ncbi:MAG: hypothetical protein ACREQQ_08355, partial [Candidatus Binatia bacterium]
MRRAPIELTILAAIVLGASCVDSTAQPWPLLGDLEANGGRSYAAVFCEDNPDPATPLPPDPRELIAGPNLGNPNYGVYYNDPFEICETDTLFATQARQNALLVARGQQPVYTAKPRPETCGEWRDAVERGRRYIVTNPITGGVLTPQTIINVAKYLGYTIPTDSAAANALLGKVVQERYGWPASPYRNPFPFPGEDPNTTDGGSGQLPIALAQVKDDDGKWTGKLGATCFACHVGQIGRGEVVGNSAARDGHPEIYGGAANGMFLGLNGSNTDNGLALHDSEQANGKLGPDSFNVVLNNPPHMANRTRGTNAADQEIVNVLFGRDLDTLDWRSPVFEPSMAGKLVPTFPATGGDQDMPTWWWSHNKSRYLWVGFGTSGSSRNNFFPASTNPHDGHWSKRREGDFQDLDMWLNALEAPKFVGPPVNIALAEEGAILFHTKDLWAGGMSELPPRPPTKNGSCAGCHGVYSPAFIHQPGFLPDPRLAGMSGYTVPLEIVGTDPEQSNLFSANAGYSGESARFGRAIISGGLADAWFAYPDGREGYRLPEEKTPIEESIDDFSPISAPGKCKLGTKGGYTAQPLHGVWASGPYFHNGSVPTVWDVLKPSDRPNVWRRQQVPQSEASPLLGDRGFDTVLSRAYNYVKLGWEYERLDCDARSDASSLSCQPSQYLPAPLDVLLTPIEIVADYLSPPGPDAVNERAVYNTNAYSKGNQGHEYTKVLTDEERHALIEYLKTL